MIRRAEEHVIRFNEDYEGLIPATFMFTSARKPPGCACAKLCRRMITSSAPIESRPVYRQGGDRAKSWPRLSARNGLLPRTGGDVSRRRAHLKSFTPRPSSAAVSRSLRDGLLPPQVQETLAVSVVFFGDGAMEEGVSTSR